MTKPSGDPFLCQTEIVVYKVFRKVEHTTDMMALGDFTLFKEGDNYGWYHVYLKLEDAQAHAKKVTSVVRACIVTKGSLYYREGDVLLADRLFIGEEIKII